MLGRGDCEGTEVRVAETSSTTWILRRNERLTCSNMRSRSNGLLVVCHVYVSDEGVGMTNLSCRRCLEQKTGLADALIFEKTEPLHVLDLFQHAVTIKCSSRCVSRNTSVTRASE